MNFLVAYYRDCGEGAPRALNYIQQGGRKRGVLPPKYTMAHVDAMAETNLKRLVRWRAVAVLHQ
jgi:hypothetical protein